MRSIEVRDVLLRRLLRACWSLQPALHMLSRICTWTGLTLATPALGRGSSPATSAPEPVCSRVNGAYLVGSMPLEVSASEVSESSDVSGSSQVSGFDLAWQLNGPYRGIDGDLACTHEALASCYLRQGVLRLACRNLADGALPHASAGPATVTTVAAWSAAVCRGVSHAACGRRWILRRLRFAASPWWWWVAEVRVPRGLVVPLTAIYLRRHDRPYPQWAHGGTDTPLNPWYHQCLKYNKHPERREYSKCPHCRSSVRRRGAARERAQNALDAPRAGGPMGLTPRKAAAGGAPGAAYSRATCSVPTCEPPGGACSMQRVTRRRRRRIGRGTPGALHGDSRVLYGTPGALQGVGLLQIRSRQLCRDTSFLSQAKFAPHSSPATHTPAHTLARTADTHPHEAAKLRQTPASRCTSRGKVYNGWNYTACAFRLESCVAVGRSMGRVCGRLHIPVCCVSPSACHTLLAARRTNSGWTGCTKSVPLTPAMVTF